MSAITLEHVKQQVDLWAAHFKTVRLEPVGLLYKVLPGTTPGFAVVVFSWIDKPTDNVAGHLRSGLGQGRVVVNYQRERWTERLNRALTNIVAERIKARSDSTLAVVHRQQQETSEKARPAIGGFNGATTGASAPLKRA